MKTINHRNREIKANTINLALSSIENEILSGQYYPHQRLIEVEIAQKLGLSRTPVREALKQLETKGLVTRLPTRGLIVTPVTAEVIKNTFEVREALETMAIRLACERATVNNLNRAEKYLFNYKNELDKLKKQGLRRSVRNHDSPDWNEMFHTELYSASGNPKLVNYIQSIRDVQQLSYVSRFFGDLDFVLFETQHQNILDGVRRRDNNKAERAVVQHLRTVEDMYMKYLRG